MFWIFEILSGKESKAKKKYKELNSFELAWNEFENWYLDNNVLR